jgi:hypothetical protein
VLVPHLQLNLLTQTPGLGENVIELIQDDPQLRWRESFPRSVGHSRGRIANTLFGVKLIKSAF